MPFGTQNLQLGKIRLPERNPFRIGRVYRHAIRGIRFADNRVSLYFPIFGLMVLATTISRSGRRNLPWPAYYF